MQAPARALQQEGIGARSYRTDVDGLRSVAILSVVLYHAGVPLLTGGFCGVDIFFVISGYLIGGHIFSELLTGSFSYLKFYQRRAKRILPAYLVVILFVICASLLLLSPMETARVARDALAATLSVSNILFLRSFGYFNSHSELNPLLMTWSLGVEEQFYLFIPLIMTAIHRFRRGWMLPAIVLVCILSFLLAVLELGRNPMLVFYMLPPRAWELGVGVALAIAEARTLRRELPRALMQGAGVLGLVLVLAPMFLLTSRTAFPGASALPSVLGTAMLLASQHHWINRRILSLPPLVFVGRISYSFYLWHWPLLAFGRILYADKLPPVAACCLIFLAFLASVLSYHYIEQPFRKSPLAPVPLLTRYALAGAVVVAACTLVWASHGVPERNPELASMEKSGQTIENDPCLAPDGKDLPNLTPTCYKTAASGKAIALWGDSHSTALAPALRAEAEAHGVGFVQIGKASCPPLDGAARFFPEHVQSAAECLRFNDKVLHLLESDRSIDQVFLAGIWAAPFHRNYEDGWLTADVLTERNIPSPAASRGIFESSFAETVRSLQAAGKQVVVFQDVPKFGVDPLWRVRTARIAARHELARWLDVPDRDDSGFATPSDPSLAADTAALLKQTVAKLPGAELVDLQAALCTDSESCEYREGNELLYSDSHHLSPQGASLVLRRVEPLIPSTN